MFNDANSFEKVKKYIVYQECLTENVFFAEKNVCKDVRFSLFYVCLPWAWYVQVSPNGQDEFISSLFCLFWLQTAINYMWEKGSIMILHRSQV